MTTQRCGWCSSDPLYIDYHDHEWGKPLHDEKQLFAMLCLEGQQAGLSWITVLKKREHYHRQFFQYSIEQIAALSDTDLAEKVQDIGLIRHIGKLTAIRDNALAWQALKNKALTPLSGSGTLSNNTQSTMMSRTTAQHLHRHLKAKICLKP